MEEPAGATTSDGTGSGNATAVPEEDDAPPSHEPTAADLPSRIIEHEEIAVDIDPADIHSVTLGVSWESTSNLDLDCALLLFDKRGSILETIEGVGKLASECGGVVHQGDSVTGGEEGDAEAIQITLPSVSEKIHAMVVVVLTMMESFEEVSAVKSRIYVSQLNESLETSAGALSCSPKFHVDDELLNVHKSISDREDESLQPSSLNIALMMRLYRKRGNKRVWVVNSLGHLSQARRMPSAVIAAQEQLLDIFPKIRIPLGGPRDLIRCKTL